MENEGQESLELQDPLHKLIRQGSWHSVPNPIWFVTQCMMDTRARLFSYICRMTIGFLSKKTKVFRLAMPWPGHEKVALRIGVNSKNNLSTARKQLESSLMIIVWKEPGTRKEWVGVNPALFHLPPLVARFVSENCGKYDFKKDGWEEQIRKSQGAEESEILESRIYNLRVQTLESYTYESRILYSDLEGYLYTFKDDSKVPEPVKALNKTLYNKMIDRDRSAASQKKSKGKAKAQTTPAPQKENSPASDELEEHLFAAHKKHCQGQGKWARPNYKVQITEEDKAQGFPKAAASLLTRLSSLKYSLATLADRYVEFVVDMALKRGWPNPPHGGNYSDDKLIDKFFHEDETILEAQKSEKRKAERERKQKQEEEWKKEQKEIERKEKEELERIKEVFETGERLCIGKWRKYEDLCKECKEKTEKTWYKCRLKSAGGNR